MIRPPLLTYTLQAPTPAAHPSKPAAAPSKPGAAPSKPAAATAPDHKRSFMTGALMGAVGTLGMLGLASLFSGHGRPFGILSFNLVNLLFWRCL